MNKNKDETMREHMKGFFQGFLFILVIIVIILFFHLIGYIDKSMSPVSYGDDSDIEYWSEDKERSDGIKNGGDNESTNKKIYEERKTDFGSKSLNQKDKDKEKAAKEQADEERGNLIKRGKL